MGVQTVDLCQTVDCAGGRAGRQDSAVTEGSIEAQVFARPSLEIQVKIARSSFKMAKSKMNEGREEAN